MSKLMHNELLLFVQKSKMAAAPSWILFLSNILACMYVKRQT